MVVFVAMLHLAPLLSVFGLIPGGRVAYTVDTVTCLPIFLALGYVVRFSSSGSFNLTRLDWCVLAYLILSVLSVVLYLQPGNPSQVDAYFYGIHHFVLPIFGYFAVKMLTRRQQRNLLLIICLLNFFAMLFGIYMYYARLDSYSNYLRDTAFVERSGLEDWQVYGRMQSYLGSTAAGVVAAVTITLLSLNRNGFPLMAVIMPTMLIAALLTYQRGGIAGCILALLYLVYFDRKFFVKKVVTVIFALSVLLYSLSLFEQKYEATMERAYERSTAEMLDVFFDRGYGSGLRYVAEFPFGVGLGGASSAAESAGLSLWGQVVDANFMRIAADLGIPGFGVFLLVLAAGYHATLKKQDTLGWITVLSIFCGVALGTNTLDSHYVSHSFWMILGFIDTPDPLRKPVPVLKPRNEVQTSDVARESECLEL